MNPEILNRIITFLSNAPGGMRTADLNAQDIQSALSGNTALEQILAAKKIQAPGGPNNPDAQMYSQAGFGVANAGASAAQYAATGATGAPVGLIPLAGQAIATYGLDAGKNNFARPFSTDSFRNNSFLDEQIPGFSRLKPEMQDRIIYTAKLAGYVPGQGGGDFDKKTGMATGPEMLPRSLNVMPQRGDAGFSKENILTMAVDPRLNSGARAKFEAFRAGVQDILNDPNSFVNRISGPSTTQELNAVQRPTPPKLENPMLKLPPSAGTGDRPTPGNPPKGNPPPAYNTPYGPVRRPTGVNEELQKGLEKILSGGNSLVQTR